MKKKQWIAPFKEISLKSTKNIFQKKKEKKKAVAKLEIGKWSAISPEGWQAEERGLPLCALCFSISITWLAFSSFLNEFNCLYIT